MNSILILVSAIVIDWILGTMQAIYNKNYISSVGKRGLLNHVSQVIIYIFLYFLCKEFKIANVVNLLIYPAIINQVFSMFENLGKMNVKIPLKIKGIFGKEFEIDNEDKETD